MRTLQLDGEGGGLGQLYSIYSVRLCSCRLDKIAPIDAGKAVSVVMMAFYHTLSNETGCGTKMGWVSFFVGYFITGNIHDFTAVTFSRDTKQICSTQHFQFL